MEVARQPTTTSHEPQLPNLLKRLGERDSEVSKYSQFIEVQTDEQLGSHDEPSHVEITRSVVIQEPGKTERREILEATRDGKDITSEKRKNAAEEEAKRKAKKAESIELSFENPFKATEQSRYHYQLIGKSSQAPDHVRVRFEPKGKASQNTMIGEAEVDPSTGDVFVIHGRPSEFPSHVSKLDVTMTFDASTPSGRALSKVQVLGEGGFLFFKAKMRTTVTLSDYKKGASEPENAKRESTQPH